MALQVGLLFRFTGEILELRFGHLAGDLFCLRGKISSRVWPLVLHPLNSVAWKFCSAFGLLYE